MTKTKYIVNVDYQTNSGNPATKRMVVSAWTDNEAIDVATARVRHLKTCMKVNGGSIESPVSSDFDWNAEVIRLGEVRGKAIQYISKAVGEGLFIGDYYVPVANDNIELRLIKPNGDMEVELLDEEIEPISQNQMAASDWIELAAHVQKAIAERNPQP